MSATQRKCVTVNPSWGGISKLFWSICTLLIDGSIPPMFRIKRFANLAPLCLGTHLHVSRFTHPQPHRVRCRRADILHVPACRRERAAQCEQRVLVGVLGDGRLVRSEGDGVAPDRDGMSASTDEV